MTLKHKDFILHKLIPFILREEGRGFGMEHWLSKEPPKTKVRVDEIYREVPKCGTVACIGGSIAYLLGLDKNPACSPTNYLESLGLTLTQRNALFYGWEGNRPHRWPDSFVRRYAEAKTTWDKSKVACDLLHEIVRTEGACLIVGKPL